MSPLLLGLLWAAVFAVPVSLLSRVRVRVRARTRPAPRPRGHASRLPAEPVSPRSWKGAARLLAVNVVLLFGLDTLTFYFGRPMMTFVGLVPLILVNLAIVAVITPFATYRRLNAGSVAATLALVTSFVGTVSSVGPALVLAQAGDQVTITVLDVGGQESTQTMQTFTDARIPLNPPGT